MALARERAARAGADARFLTGEAGRLPLPDGAFDAAASAFAVIFAPDPARALAEMVRVTRPGGAVALTSWRSEGPIFAAGRILREAFPSGDGAGPEPRWHDAAWVAEALGAAGARDVRTTTARLGYSAESPEAWLAEHEEHHPAWRWGRRTLGPEAWRGVRARMLAALARGQRGPLRLPHDEPLPGGGRRALSTRLGGPRCGGPRAGAPPRGSAPPRGRRRSGRSAGPRWR